MALALVQTAVLIALQGRYAEASHYLPRGLAMARRLGEPEPLVAGLTTLAQATLTAPFDGTVASVDIAPAETVVPGQIVITLGDMTHFQIETTDLSERDVPKVQVGQTANVSIDALDQEFTGKVSDIARVSSTVGGDVVYKVTIELDNQPADLRWGMSADVEIPTGQ